MADNGQFGVSEATKDFIPQQPDTAGLQHSPELHAENIATLMFPQVQEQKMAQPGGVKRAFSGFLYGMQQALRKDAGLATDYDIADQKIRQQTADTNEGYRAANAALAQAKAKEVAPRALSQQEADTLNTSVGNNIYSAGTMMHPAAIDALLKQGAINTGKQGIADTNANTKITTTGMTVASRDRTTDIMAQVRRDAAEGNMKLAQARLSLMQTLGYARLQQGQDRIDFQQNGPTSTMRTMGQTAGDLRQLFPDMRKQISDLDAQGKLGPIAGRWEDFLANKVGDADPAYERFRVASDLLDTGLMKAHFGGRGAVQAMDHFKSLFNSGKASAAQLNAALDSIDRQLQLYQEGGRYKKPGAGGEAATHIYVPGKGIQPITR